MRFQICLYCWVLFWMFLSVLNLIFVCLSPRKIFPAPVKKSRMLNSWQALVSNPIIFNIYISRPVSMQKYKLREVSRSQAPGPGAAPEATLSFSNNNTDADAGAGPAAPGERPPLPTQPSGMGVGWPGPPPPSRPLLRRNVCQTDLWF